MSSFLHLPRPQNGVINSFAGFSTTIGGQWEVWNKPRGISFMKIICIGGGGGGGGGSGLSAGGSGGASGGTTNLLMSTVFLPDRLYVSAGVGGFRGLGGTGNSGGTAGDGIASYVSIAPSSAAIYTLCYANGGGGGAGGTVGTAAAVAVQSSALQSGQGIFTAYAGQAGSNRGLATTPATNITYPTTGLLLSGGAGGGGSSSAGAVVAAPASQTSTYSIFQTGTAASGTADGASGLEIFPLLLSTGGAGGGGNAGTTAGNGGKGGFGSGGGGGGCAGTGTGGAGGDGGSGLVIISCW